ncbi:MAG: hypothetical protein QNJ84_11975 [Alphaproteobacteria bacterium]|nr:hypothetical protein [Alphaproteobacteria bacterium]
MLKTDLTPAQVALLPKIEDDPERFGAILGRFESRSVREVHDSQLADIAFLDLKALEVAGLLERKRRSRFSGWQLTESGSRAVGVRMRKQCDD